MPLTDDAVPTTSSPQTHFHSYNASASPNAYSLFSGAKAGIIPPNDKNDDPIPYGVGGVISEADTLEAFSHLELWANDSAEEPWEFAAGRREALGLSTIPFEM